jgi:2-iminobutanoate/2-iminopropanoate deaminase
MSKKIIFTEKAPAAIGPYSQAVLAGNTLYVSGQIALDLAPLGDIKAETQRIMEISDTYLLRPKWITPT